MYSTQLKGQSAIEYLMTYGWMLLVVAIAGGSVFSLVQGQNIEDISGFNSNEITVSDFGLSRSQGLIFSLNSPNPNIEISQVKISDQNNKNISYILNKDLDVEDTISLPGLDPSSESKELSVEILYNTGELKNITVSGTVQGSLAVNNEFNNNTIILDGLKGYWPLTEDYSEATRVYDVSGNENHGEINGPTFTEDEEFRRVMTFGGLGSGDNVQVDHSSSLNITNEITMAAWVKHTVDPDQTENNEYRGIMSKGGFDSYQFLLEDSGQFNPSVYVDDDRLVPRASSIYFSIGEWHHIAYTHTRNGEGRIYVDGEQVNEASSEPTPMDINDNPFWIGNAPGDAWNGSIAEVMLYERALSGKEISTLYNNHEREP